jgi:hypothetical protein
MAGTDAASNEAMANGRSLVRIRLFILDRPSGSQRKGNSGLKVKNVAPPGAGQATSTRSATPIDLRGSKNSTNRKNSGTLDQSVRGFVK